MIKFTIAFIVIGLIAFTSMAVFEQEIWARGYALWDKGKDVLLVGIIAELSRKKYGQLFMPLFYFVIIRLAWDVISWITGLDVNNAKVVGFLFIIYSIYVLYKLIKDARN